MFLIDRSLTELIVAGAPDRSVGQQHERVPAASSHLDHE